ncbi:MAG: GAF domain-containing protein, partial [Chloroflexi bacterium]
MLRRLYQNHPEKFETIAQAWLASGASSFSISEYGQELASWSRGRPALNEPKIKAPIRCLDLTVGELSVTGSRVRDPHIRNQLAAEAEFLAHVLMVEGELEAMTAELVSMQDQLLALYDIAIATRAQVNVVEIVKALTQAVARLLRVEGAFMMLAHPQHKLFVDQFPENRLPEASLKQVYRQVVEMKHYIISNGYDVHKPLPAGVQKIIACPLRIQGEICAVLGVYNKLDDDFISPDLKLVQIVAQQAEAHIENALLVEENLKQARLQAEMKLAHQVQAQLLPSVPPSVSGLDIYASSIPALEVGGDFFDFVAQPEKPFLFVLGDVSGKGMAAAMLMAVTRTVIRSSARLLPEPTPARLLGRICEDLYADMTDVGMFTTAFIGSYDVVLRRLVYAN